MPDSGEVVIIVAGEDQSGAVMQAVEQNLARVQARAVAADRGMSGAGAHAVPAMAAASASVRVLDGDFSHLLRAEERFLSTLPGAQVLMQAAFPAIGVLAVGEGIYRMGSAVTEFIHKMSGMAGTIERDFGDANLEVAKSNDTLRVTNDRLEMSIAKLEKKPGNGLQLALDEARLSADNLALSLIKDNDRVTELMRKDSVGPIAGFFTHQDSTGDAEKIQKEYAEASRKIVFAGQERERAAKTADEAQAIRTQTQNELYALQGRTLDQISGKLKSLNAARNAENAFADTHLTFLPGLNRKAAESDLQNLYGSISQQQESVQLTAGDEDKEKEQKAAQAKHDQLETQRTMAREAAEERKKEEEFLKRMEKLGVGSSPQAGTTRAAQDAKLLQESNHEAAEALDSTVETVGKSWVADAEAAAKSSKEQIEALREVQEERMRAAGDRYKNVDEDTRYGVKSGQISETQRFAALRAAATEEYEIRRNALEQMKELDNINPDDPEKVQRDLDQILELQTKYSRQMVQLSQEQAAGQRAAVEGYVHSILDPLITGTATVSQRFKKMADDILEDLERIAEKKAEGYVTNALLGGGGGQGGVAGGKQGGSGIAAGVIGLLGKLFGHKGSGTASNGGLATGAGTTADAIAAGLQQGGASTANGGGVQVMVINQGTPQQATSSTSSGGGMEQQVISIVLKDADSLGPMSKAIGGAISMMGN